MNVLNVNSQTFKSTNVIKPEALDIEKTLEITSDLYRYATNNDDRMYNKMLEFYDEGIKNPTLALLIAQHCSIQNVQKNAEKLEDDIAYLRGEPKSLIKDFIKSTIMCVVRIQAAMKDPNIQKKHESFEAKMKTLYPKTCKLRKKIAGNRVVFDKFNPCLPSSFKKTIKYAFCFFSSFPQYLLIKSFRKSIVIY